MSIDAGWYPQDHISLTGFYTREKYDAAQSARGFFNDASAADPANDWFADTRDEVDTWQRRPDVSPTSAPNAAGKESISASTTPIPIPSSDIDVTAVGLDTAPLPELQAEDAYLHALGQRPGERQFQHQAGGRKRRADDPRLGPGRRGTRIRWPMCCCWAKAPPTTISG